MKPWPRLSARGVLPGKRDADMKAKWFLFPLICLAGLARFWASALSEIGADEERILYQALDWVIEGKLSVVGAKVVYSGTVLPGSLQALLVGTPLLLAPQFSFLSVSMGIAILSTLGAVITLFCFSHLRGVSKGVLSSPLVWILGLFAPWSVWFVQLWNPSFLPLMGAIFYWGWCLSFADQDITLNSREDSASRLKTDSRSKESAGFFLMIFATLLCLQMHLSFVLLVAALGLGFFARWRSLGFPFGAAAVRPMLSFREVLWAFVGLFVGSVTLLPYIVGSVGELSKQGSSNDFLLANVRGLNLEHLYHPVQALTRFLSFSGSDLSRFSGEAGQGLRGAWIFAVSEGGLLPVFLVLSLLAAGLTGVS